MFRRFLLPSALESMQPAETGAQSKYTLGNIIETVVYLYGLKIVTVALLDS